MGKTDFGFNIPTAITATVPGWSKDGFSMEDATDPFGWGNPIDGITGGGDDDGYETPSIDAPGMYRYDENGDRVGGPILEMDAYTNRPWLNEGMDRNLAQLGTVPGEQTGWYDHYQNMAGEAPLADYGLSDIQLESAGHVANDLRGEAGRYGLLGDNFGKMARGELGPSVAELQLRQEAERMGAQQYGRAASASAANRAGAMRTAANNSAMMQAKANQAAGIQRAQEAQAAYTNQIAAYGAATKANTAAGGLHGDVASVYGDNAEFNADQVQDQIWEADSAGRARWGVLKDEELRREVISQVYGDQMTAGYDKQKDAETDAIWGPAEINAGLERGRRAAEASKEAGLLGAAGTAVGYIYGGPAGGAVGGQVGSKVGGA